MMRHCVLALALGMLSQHGDPLDLAEDRDDAAEQALADDPAPAEMAADGGSDEPAPAAMATDDGSDEPVEDDPAPSPSPEDGSDEDVSSGDGRPEIQDDGSDNDSFDDGESLLQTQLRGEHGDAVQRLQARQRGQAGAGDASSDDHSDDASDDNGSQSGEEKGDDSSGKPGGEGSSLSELRGEPDDTVKHLQARMDKAEEQYQAQMRQAEQRLHEDIHGPATPSSLAQLNSQQDADELASVEQQLKAAHQRVQYANTDADKYISALTDQFTHQTTELQLPGATIESALDAASGLPSSFAETGAEVGMTSRAFQAASSRSASLPSMDQLSQQLAALQQDVNGHLSALEQERVLGK